MKKPITYGIGRRFLINLSLTLFVLLFGFELYAQTYHPFPTKNAVWTEMNFFPYPDYGYEFHSYALKDSDTIIDGKLYHKLYHSTDTIFTEDKLCGGLREEDKKLYYYSIKEIPYLLTKITEGTEVLLFDFSLNSSDTLYFPIRRSTNDEYIITKTDSVNINNSFYKEYTISYSKEVTLTPFVWLEGIGYKRGLLYATGDFPNNGMWNDLICFKKDNKILYHYDYYKNCYYLPSGIEPVKSDRLVIYPNPVKFNGNIETDGLSYQFLELYDIYGRKVAHYCIEGTKMVSFTVQGFIPGIYLGILTGNNVNPEVVKFSVE